LCFLCILSLDQSIYCWDIRQAGPNQCLMMFDQQRGACQPFKRSWKSMNESSVVTAHNGSINGLALSEDGLWLFSIGADDRIRCWNTDQGRPFLVNYPEFTLASKLPVQFCTSHSTDPPLVCVPVQHSLHIYDGFKGDLLDKFHSHYDTIHCVAYHPFRQECFTGSKDHTILSYTPCETFPSDEREDTRIGQRSFSEDYFSDDESSFVPLSFTRLRR
jgi:WD40 repeat protein